MSTSIERSVPPNRTLLRGWPPLLVLPTLVAILAPAETSRWAYMWLLAVAIFIGCKWLTWRRTPAPGATPLRHLGYLFAWPGLDATTFLNPALQPIRPRLAEWLFASFKLLAGVTMLFGVVRFVPAEFPYLAGWLGMVGLAMVLHFGIFHLLSCAWRRAGVDAKPLMDWPLAAPGLADFWGRRWNTAFRDLTHRFLFRSFVRWFGPRWAVGAGFLFSGLVHEAVISLPAGGGYGGPTLFFAIQGLALLFERNRFGRRIGLGRGVRGRLFTGVVLLAPAVALFHPPFVLGIVVPFLAALGAF